MPPFFGKLYHNSNTISNYLHTFGHLIYLTTSHSKVLKVSIVNLNIAKNSNTENNLKNKLSNSPKNIKYPLKAESCNITGKEKSFL